MDTLKKSFNLIKQKEEIEANATKKHKKIFDFGIGDSKEETPEFIAETIKSSLPLISQYPPTHGLPELKIAAAAWIKRRFHVDIQPLNIISANGSKEAIFHSVCALLNQDHQRKKIIVPVPAYPTYEKTVLFHGGTPIYYELTEDNNYCFNPQDIEKPEEIRAVWINSPHNPTGSCLTIKQIKEIYDWALKYNIFILSDECYADVYFHEKPPSFLEIAQSFQYKNLLCFYSLSKRSRMTGYRSGFMTGDPSFIDFFKIYRNYAGIGTPSFVQKAAEKAWLDDTHVHQLNDKNKEKRELVLQFLDKHKISYFDDRIGGIYIWAKVPNCFESGFALYETLASDLGIIVSPGELFYEKMPQYFRVALCPKIEDIRTSLELIEQLVKRKEAEKK